MTALATSAFTTSPLNTSLAADQTQENAFYVSGTGGGSVPLADNFTLPAADAQYAFTMPVSGTLSQVYADYTVTAQQDLPREGTLAVRLYGAPAGSLDFALLPGGDIPLSPSVSGNVPAGSMFTGSSALAAPVAAGEKLLAVVYLTSGTGGGEMLLPGVASLSTVVEVGG